MPCTLQFWHILCCFYSNETEAPCAAGLSVKHCGPAEWRVEPAALAVCGAKRWLAHGAPSVKIIRNGTGAAAPACTSLVSCLPAVEQVELYLRAQVGHEDLGCLLEALAGCPHLKALELRMYLPHDGEPCQDLYWLFPAPALAQLGSLTSLALGFGYECYALADVVVALAPLTGLVKLCIGFAREADKHLVPAALGRAEGITVADIRWRIHLCA